MNARSVFIAVTTGCVLAMTTFVSTTLADHRPGNVVVVGGTLALSGRYAEPAGRYLNAWTLYVDELNQRGGLLGHKVELKILDDRSDTRTAIELYEKLITANEVDLVQGPYSSAITDAVANVMEVHKRPFVGSGASRVIWERGRRYIFSLPQAQAPAYQNGALHIARALGIKRIAILGQGSLFPRQTTAGTLELAEKLGMEIVFLRSYHKDEKDFTSLLKAIEASDAEAIFSNSYFADSVAQLRQMRELGINVTMFAGTVGPGLPKFTEELGDTAEFVLGSTQWEPRPTLGYPNMQGFIEEYEKRYGVMPNYHAAGGYGVMQILEAAVKHANSFEPEKVRDALASITVETIKGPYKADARGLSTMEGLTFQIQNGRRVIVWPEYISEAKYMLPMPPWDERPSN